MTWIFWLSVGWVVSAVIAGWAIGRILRALRKGDEEFSDEEF